MSLIYRKSKSNRRERDGTNNHTGKLNLESDLSVDGKISIISETSTPSQPSDGTGHIYIQRVMVKYIGGHLMLLKQN